MDIEYEIILKLINLTLKGKFNSVRYAWKKINKQIYSLEANEFLYDIIFEKRINKTTSKEENSYNLTIQYNSDFPFIDYTVFESDKDKYESFNKLFEIITKIIDAENLRLKNILLNKLFIFEKDRE